MCVLPRWSARQALDQRRVLGIAPHEGGAIRQLEVGKLEARRHRAPDQGVGRSGRDRCAEPGSRGHACLMELAGVGVGSEDEIAPGPFRRDHRHDEGTAGIEVPELVRLEAVQARDLSVAQQEVDRRRCHPRPSVPGRQGVGGNALGGAIGFAVVPTLGMRGQTEVLDPERGGAGHSRMVPRGRPANRERGGEPLDIPSPYERCGVGCRPGTSRRRRRPDPRSGSAVWLVMPGVSLIVKGGMARPGEDLIARMAERDTEALARFYDRYAPLAFSLILRIVRDRTDASEVLQDVFWESWQAAGAYDPARGTPEAWVSTRARARAIDRVRSLRRRHEMFVTPVNEALTAEAEPGPDPAESAELRGAVVSALAQLSDSQREVIELAYYAGLTQSEIAARTKQPLGTVKTRIRLGLERLREVATRPS